MVGGRNELLTPEEAAAFPWDEMHVNCQDNSFLHMCSGRLRQVHRPWLERFRPTWPEELLHVAMLRDTFPIALAMSRHPRLGEKFLLSRLEPGVFQLIH